MGQKLRCTKILQGKNLSILVAGEKCSGRKKIAVPNIFFSLLLSLSLSLSFSLTLSLPSTPPSLPISLSQDLIPAACTLLHLTSVHFLNPIILPSQDYTHITYTDTHITQPNTHHINKHKHTYILVPKSSHKCTL